MTEPREPDETPAGPGNEVLELELPADLSSPAVARRAVTDVLHRWRMHDLIDSVSLVVSELVTNAVRHGVPPVRMFVHRTMRELRLGVHDGSSASPAPRTAGDGAEGGRGLALVKGFADRLDVEQIDDDGKVVYAHFALDPPVPREPPQEPMQAAPESPAE